MRRFDKIKNIQKANILNEQLYLTNKNPYYIVEGVLAIDENDLYNENFTSKMLFESIIECGLNLENLLIDQIDVLNENKKMINESLIGAGIGMLLATGKFIDVIGVLFRKIRNKMVDWGWLGKDAKTWKTTNAEKIGDWWKEKIIDPIFNVGAKFLLGVIGVGVTAFLGVLNPNENRDYMGEIMSEKNVKDLGAVLFYGTISALSLTAVFGGITELIHHGQIWAAVVEKIATGTKFYEILLLIVAFFFATSIEIYKPFKSKLLPFAHALGECLEGSSFIRILQKIGKGVKQENQKIVTCVNHHLNIHDNHGEQGDGSNHNTVHDTSH